MDAPLLVEPSALTHATRKGQTPTSQTVERGETRERGGEATSSEQLVYHSEDTCDAGRVPRDGAEQNGRVMLLAVID